jgi:hypothetical protein
VTFNSRSLAATAASAVLLLSLAACSSPGSTPAATPTATAETGASAVTDGACTGDEGVTVVVDSSALEDSASGQWCVAADDTVPAAEALAAAEVETEGTEEYGDQVVCRVEGVPAEDTAIAAEDGTDYFETCQAMPAAFAYWSLWVKPAGGAWGYAQEGLSTLQLEPGDAVQLLFTLHGEPAAPSL